MSTHADPVEKHQGRRTDGGPAQRRSAGEAALRPPDGGAAASHRRLQEMANNSPRVRQLKAVAELANRRSSPRSQPPAQRQANDTGLPDDLRSRVEGLSGISLDDVKVHYDSARAAQLQAHAFAQGSSIHVAPGMEKHLPHEAWHVVQQKQGRVRPTVQVEGGVKVNDDPALEREADAMAAKSLQGGAGGDGGAASAPVQRSVDGEVIQNVLIYKGERFESMQALAKSKNGAYEEYERLRREKDPERTMAASPRIYDLERGLEDVTDQVGAGAQEQGYQPAHRELARRDEPFTGQSVYNVTVDEGAGFLDTDQIQILGTEGLNGCVAVMVQSQHQQSKGYLLAHVSSEHAGNEEKIKEQLSKILNAVSKLVQRELSWKDFDVKEDSPHQITLVRSDPGRQENLYFDMVKILASTGATFFEAVSPKVFIDIGSPGNKYGAQTEALLNTGNLAEDRTAGYGPVTARTEVAREVRRFTEDVKAAKVSPTIARVSGMLEDLDDAGIARNDPMRNDLNALLDLARLYDFQDIPDPVAEPTEEERRARELGLLFS
jgi:hypothetical protein